ncbi:MAG: HmuY family protein [Chitinophaga sp.]|uniref:HmuY family protein n=1 Tax=Chitinophaga sp. TaxID=1869181 RepID=UPI001AFEDE96|nr:HmuY family protein [Chitinophaga sp.]MBO9727465.1 HmuY family protein [Chitinophaga sp.]
MNKQFFSAGALLLSFVVLSSCSKDDDKNTPAPVVTLQSKTVANIDGDAAGKDLYTFYSLADNKVIPNSDSATSKWDIGFKSTTLIINGGSSGPGKGEAQVITGVYNNLVEAPAAGYKTDAAATKAITGWYSYNMTTHIITPVAGTIIVLKTATGKYAKLEITSYYKNSPATPDDKSERRYYSFRYVYQADGSRNFK